MSTHGSAMPDHERVIAIDSSVLGKILDDCASSDAKRRERSTRFIEAIKTRGLWIGIAWTHVIELVRHGNQQVAAARVRALRSLPRIACLRAYNCSSFVGADMHLVQREMHSWLYLGLRDWEEIVTHTRQDAWTFGDGASMIPPTTDRAWGAFRELAISDIQHEKMVASIARTDPGKIGSRSLFELRSAKPRSLQSRTDFLPSFVQDLAGQLLQHGDRGLAGARRVAKEFAARSFGRVDRVEATGGDPSSICLYHPGVPETMLDRRTTCSEFGELTVVAELLAVVGEGLNPPAKLSLHNVELDAVPTLAMERVIRTIQRKAPIVSGSDVGDRALVMLAIYADFVVVDKRTHEFVRQLRATAPRLGKLLGRVVKCRSYTDLPAVLESASAST